MLNIFNKSLKNGQTDVNATGFPTLVPVLLWLSFPLLRL